MSNGFGLDGMGTIGLDSRGIFSLRAQLGWIQYSRKTETFFVQSGLRPRSSSSRRRRAACSPSASGRSSWRLRGRSVRTSRGRSASRASPPRRRSTSPRDSRNSGTKETLDQQTVSSDYILSLAGAAGIAFQLSIFGRLRRDGRPRRAIPPQRPGELRVVRRRAVQRNRHPDDHPDDERSGFHRVSDRGDRRSGRRRYGGGCLLPIPGACTMVVATARCSHVRRVASPE